jgi:NhaB family Na+:H+ antiporter
VHALHRDNLEQFRAFLRGLMMHAAVGTAIGGVMTQVGEPQNLLIAEQADWNFVQFFLQVAPVSIPVAVAGLLTCWLLERFKLFGYGAQLPDAVRTVLRDYAGHLAAKATVRDRQVLIVQALVALTLVFGLAFHVAEVGLIGLLVIILATSFTGVVEEHRIGKAFESALPFTALLVVFFVIVAGIHDQHLFEPVIRSVLALEGRAQSAALYLATGALSTISDNVFVASIYITELKSAFLQGVITRDQFEAAAVAINTGTNIPSVATPNGQAAFLFLLTSTLAPLIRLGYLRMTWMALPYFVVMTAVGLAAVVYLL